MTGTPAEPTDQLSAESPAESFAPAPAPAASLAPSLAVAALFVAADQVTKRWAVDRLSGGRVVEVVGSLRFNLFFNEGMAFSRFRGVGQYIGVLALVVVVVLAVNLRRAESRLSSLATGMIIGGALGNIVDRLFRGEGWLKGAVVDFIDLQWWPVFNVADIGVTVGGVLLVLGTLSRARSTAAR